MWRAPIPGKAAFSSPNTSPEPTAAALEWDHPSKSPQLQPWPKECNPIAVLIPELPHPIKTMEFIPIQPLHNTSTSSPFPFPRFSQFSPVEEPNSALKQTKIPEFQLALYPPREPDSCIPLHKERKTGIPRLRNHFEPQNINKSLKGEPHL